MGESEKKDCFFPFFGRIFESRVKEEAEDVRGE